MKKIGFTAISLALIMSATCYASLPSNDIAIGGIQIGSPIAKVFATYGQPTRTENQGYKYYYYGKTISVRSNGKTNELVDFIKSTGNNGWNTPAGIHVGSTRKEVVNAYGTPDSAREFKGVMFFTYQNRDNALQSLNFKINNDKVIEMYLEWASAL